MANSWGEISQLWGKTIIWGENSYHSPPIGAKPPSAGQNCRSGRNLLNESEPLSGNDQMNNACSELD